MLLLSLYCMNTLITITYYLSTLLIILNVMIPIVLFGSYLYCRLRPSSKLTYYIRKYIVDDLL